jgi:zinc transport system ATP-binding protein
MEIVTVKNVSAVIDHTPILEDVTFAVENHDFLSIIGPNGGGKTTLIKVLLGLITPTRGEVTVFGSPPEKGRNHIGYLPQEVVFDSNFPITVFDVVITGRYQRVLTQYSDADKEIVFDVLETVNMAKAADRQIGQLSGGELQRVFLARALARTPKLLLLDEPTASIDPEMRKSFYELLVTLKETMAIVLVTHDVSVVSVYVDKMVCLNRRLMYCGSVADGLKSLENMYQSPVEVLSHGIPHKEAV